MTVTGKVGSPHPEGLLHAKEWRQGYSKMTLPFYFQGFSSICVFRPIP